MEPDGYKELNLNDLTFEFTFEPKHIIKKKDDIKVIINPPAVILFRNGKKYVAKAQDEPFDAERGLTIALLRSFGIGYSDLQKMLNGAKRQNEELKIKVNAEEFRHAVYKALEETAKEYGFIKPKKKCGRPRKTDNIDNYAKMLKEKGILSRTAKDEPAKPKAKRGRPHKIKQDEVYTWESEELKREMSIDDCNKMPKVVKVKRPVGRPRKFRKGDIIAIKEQRTYKYAKINNRANNRLFRDIYEVTAVDDYNNGVFVNGLGWFLPSEVELIEKAK